MADSTLTAIQTKVRKLTRSLSESVLTTAQIDEYINTFVLYDFPEHLRLFNLKSTFSFYTQPNVDVYDTNTVNTGSPLFDFKNKYLTVHPPVYIGGFQVLTSQSREQFFTLYPMVNSIVNIGTAGNGIQTEFSGVITSSQANVTNINGLNAGLLQNNVLFSSIDSNGNGVEMVDSPIIDATTGIPTIWGLLYDPNDPPLVLPLALTAPYQSDPDFPDDNFINYSTGQYTVTFPIAPAAGKFIFSQTVPTVLSIPQAILFYDGQFTVRPVPDQPYRVTMDVFVRPTELLSENQEPKLQEWWQYIAYGAAKKVFEDRGETESILTILPEFKEQETLIQRRTLVQYGNQRASTIYSEQIDTSGSGYSGLGWGSW